MRREGPEPAADFTVIRKGPLKAFRIRRNELPGLIDEIPVLCVLATQARGRSVIEDADELRVKETDRIRSMSDGLTRMGADISSRGNTLIIQGPTPLRGASIDSYKDHRTAMSHVVAGLIASGPTTVNDIECINTSFPNFFTLLKRLTPQ
jgi:3-phosphoshikimate 1-carboxyvinyltransferase